MSFALLLFGHGEKGDVQVGLQVLAVRGGVLAGIG